MFKPELWQSHDEYRTRVTTLGRKLSRKLVDDDTTTLCKAGHKLCPWGNDPIKNTHKYRCSLKYGRITSCPHAEECSPRNYGRTVSIKNHNNLRFQPRIPRDLERYKKTI